MMKGGSLKDKLDMFGTRALIQIVKVLRSPTEKIVDAINELNVIQKMAEDMAYQIQKKMEEEK